MVHTESFPFIYRGPFTAALDQIRFIKDNNYNHFVRSCISGHNLIKYPDKSIAECKDLCSARLDCKAFEYGVHYGGRGDYRPKDCNLQDSAKSDPGCDGSYHNLDLYVKSGIIWCRV